jgi:hypothetical protein
MPSIRPPLPAIRRPLSPGNEGIPEPALRAVKAAHGPQGVDLLMNDFYQSDGFIHFLGRLSLLPISAG